MPKMDMDQEEVYIDQWLKKEGDIIEKGETVIIIETDKITSEVEAPASGRLTHILYHENETAPVTKIVAYILEEGETEDDLPNIIEPADQVESTESQSASKKLDEPEPGITLAKEEVKHRVETPATPAARRIAAENKIDLNTIEGTGPRKRVQATDVSQFIDTPNPLERKTTTSSSIELNRMRRRIADRLTTSYQTIPHIFLTVEVDMMRSESLLRQINQSADKEGLPKVSLTAYLVKVLALILKNHPYLNAFLEKDRINFVEDINVGIAAALEDGLIVPVIQHADNLSLHELNKQVRSLAQKARDGELTHEEIQGGTFTISNLGMYGITSFTSIINPPQVAILSVGAIKRRPVVIDEEDSLNVRPMMNLTLAADHRVVDGAVASNFLNELVHFLEHPQLEEK
jgi:pyruvate dehydrogenase E2 component (dihydrolipoamide acetyltransferase)